VGAVWVDKELLRDVYAAVDDAHARRGMIAFYPCSTDADIPELTRLAHTISRWSKQVFAYHRTGEPPTASREHPHAGREDPPYSPWIPKH
jgi:hypothetical protein